MIYERFSSAADIIEQDLAGAYANPDVIQEATLAETVQAVAEVPTSERKLILYTGVHPHERTTRLASDYAREWRERFGVLTVAQPTELTPHGIWTKYLAEGHLDTYSPLDPSVAINEDAIEDDLSNGAETFFVRFHSTTPRNQAAPKNATSRLDVATSLYCIDPEPYLSNSFPLRHGTPEIVAGLTSKIDDVQPLGYPANVVCVEYYTNGQAVDTVEPATNKLLALAGERHSNYVPKLFKVDDTNWWRKGNLMPSYLTQRIIGEADVAAFSRSYKPQMDTLLGHLAASLA